jgi:hypothetical protein
LQPAAFISVDKNIQLIFNKSILHNFFKQLCVEQKIYIWYYLTFSSQQHGNDNQFIFLFVGTMVFSFGG